MKRPVLLELEQWHILTGVLTGIPSIHAGFQRAVSDLQVQVACMIEPRASADHVPGQLTIDEPT